MNDYKKKYEDALENLRLKMKDFDEITINREDAEEIFPELKESGDEKIRKTLIEYFNAYPKDYYGELKKSHILAWLEKQGEQKSIDKAEPKFKVGEWVVQENIGVYKIIEICESWYEVIDVKYNLYSIAFDKEYTCHLWTIQDAKDGDVLVCPKYAGDTIPNIFIFKDIKIKDNDVFCYCSFLETFRTEGYVANADPINTDFYPATKEQRDLLFSKMHEAGYEWDKEKKKLREIGQKSAWSEEDKEMIDKIIDYMQPMPIFFESTKGKSGKEYTKEFVKNATKWLKSLKPQNTWKPSDEQMKILEDLVEDNNQRFFYPTLKSLYNDLKKLKEE